MGVFEYLGVLISVIMGLGITHLATGATKLVQNRDTVTFYLPHALWTFNHLLYLLLVWWGMFWWSNHTVWQVHEYLFITGYAIVLFFLASILFPWDMKDDINLRDYFLKNKAWFFGTFIVARVIDIPETLIKAKANLRPVPEEYFLFIGFNILIGVIGLITRNYVVQLVLPLAFIGLTIYFVTMTLLGQISA